MTKYWIGKQRSEETKEKIRKSLFGRKQGKRTVETKIKISNALKGVKRRPLSQEHKNKISESNKGKAVSNIRRLKISISLRKLGLKGNKSPAWKGGQPKCLDCSKIVSWRANRCKSCAYKVSGRYDFAKIGKKWSEERKLKYKNKLIKNGKILILLCDYCQKQFERAISSQVNKAKNPRKNTFCSSKCNAIWMKEIRKTEDHPLYRGIGKSNAKLYRQRAKEKNPEKYREERSFRSHLRSDKKRKAGGNHTLLQWKQMKEKYNNSCLGCWKKEPEIKLCRDHIIPIAKWDEWYLKNKPKYLCNDIENIQPLCVSCNSKKHAKLDWKPDGEHLSQEWQLQNGYEPNYHNDIKLHEKV